MSLAERIQGGHSSRPRPPEAEDLRCAEISIYGHECGEPVNHEADETPHRCHLADRTEVLARCTYEWTEWMERDA